MAAKHPQGRAAEHARARRPQKKDLLQAEEATGASAAAADDESVSSKITLCNLPGSSHVLLLLNRSMYLHA